MRDASIADMAGRRTLWALVRASRPRHWVKNGFVIAPALFSGHAFDLEPLLRVGGTAALFCLASSGVYLLNDVVDAAADRADPIKRFRPVASGELSSRTALLASAALVAASAAAAAWLGLSVLGILAAYILTNLLYSLWLKKVAVLEAMLLATGFVLRLVAGALAISVQISHWLLICGFLLALLLAFGKRVPEVDHPDARTPCYPAAFLTEAVTLLAGVTLVAYVLYTVAPETVAKFQGRGLLLTVPLVLFGILRYLFLLTRSGSQDPTATLLTDRPLLAAVAAWAMLAGVIVVRAGGPR
jgi:4-hydroxybenzoate polyprenyltransferase